MDPHQIERKDPDLYISDKLYPDPLQSDKLDPDPADGKPKCMEYAYLSTFQGFEPLFGSLDPDSHRSD
jgi:hypothetical protein